ncbi:spore germination protein [Symbiobacterium terraclitae]|uniref:spore germination protein n=1 Tax=Symbiobacterium terraclitae TaxID=557451 RepID=UPI0035B53BC8
MSLAEVIQYLRRWQVAEADQLADQIERCGEPLSEELMLALSGAASSMPISPSLTENLAMIRLLLGGSPDLVIRTLSLGSGHLPGAMCYLNEMANRKQVMLILESLLVRLRNEPIPGPGGTVTPQFLDQANPSVKNELVSTMRDVLIAVLTGDCVLLVEGMDVCIRMLTDSPPTRPPGEPGGEPVVRGPKDGFTEVAAINLALIRRRIRDERLRVESFTLGKRSRTRMFLLYMLGTSLPELVAEVRSRLQRIDIDAVLESGYVEELIEDQTFTLFPQVKATERPDVAVSGLLEGKVLLITDGTPHVLLMPATFAAEMQSPEDYYHRWPVASFYRFLRYVYLFVAFLGPALYIAVTTYHHELIPTNLLLRLVAAREGVPYPALLEALFMELTLEALREAGVRLPKTIGQTISIVGALVIGESAVRASLVSPVMVIVVSLTAISSFIIPLYTMSLAIRLLRFSMMILAGTFGFFGIVVGMLCLLIHLASLRSFGVPYLAPVMPMSASDLKDVGIRVPWWAMRNRPQFMPMGDHRRVGPTSQPKPPRGGK